MLANRLKQPIRVLWGGFFVVWFLTVRTIFFENISRIFVKMLDFWCLLWYNISVKRKQIKTQKRGMIYE